MTKDQDLRLRKLRANIRARIDTIKDIYGEGLPYREAQLVEEYKDDIRMLNRVLTG